MRNAKAVPIDDDFTDKERLKAEKRKAQGLRNFISWILWLCIPALLVCLFGVKLGHIVIVSGESMYPTLYSTDIIYVWGAGYEPEAGDIVVCNTVAAGTNTVGRIVKRCIATGGQTVTIDYDTNTVTVDGEVLDETYINTEDADPMDENAYIEWQNVTYTVPEGYIFVMGDNRNESLDSRSSTYGFISADVVEGKKVFCLHTGRWFGGSERESSQLSYTNAGGRTLFANDLLSTKDTQEYEYNGVTCTAYNGFIAETVCSDWNDAQNFIQMLNDSKTAPDGWYWDTSGPKTGTWKLMSSEAEFQTWAGSGTETCFGSVCYLWSGAELAGSYSYAHDWNCINGTWVGDGQSRSDEETGFLAVWVPNSWKH